jgi:hypothetical protein
MHFTTLYRNVTKRSTRSDTSNTQLKIEDEFKSQKHSTRSDTSNTQLKIEDEFKSLLPIEAFNM